ncbi:hypothetical protein OAN15_02180, partial [bacterium]|nr:hypothetical protein [bacterium]
FERFCLKADNSIKLSSRIFWCIVSGPSGNEVDENDDHGEGDRDRNPYYRDAKGIGGQARLAREIPFCETALQTDEAKVDDRQNKGQHRSTLDCFCKERQDMRWMKMR